MEYLDPDFDALPKEWTLHPLQDIAEIHNTRRAPLNARDRETRKGIYPYCGANGVVDSIDEFRFDGEYVLVAEDGGYWGKLEPSSYIMRGKFWVNNHAHVIRGKDGVANNLFLSCLLNFMNISPLIGGDARGKLTKSILERLPMVTPPLPEQRKIASVLGLVQRAIEQQERLIALTTELKKALLHKLFTEGLRGEPQKQTEIGPVPESWEVVAVNDCCTVQTGVAKGRKVDEKEALTLPYLRVANVQSGYLDLSEMKTVTIRTKEKDRYMLQKGDIVLTEGGDFDKLGRGFIWKGEVEDCIHQNHIFAVRVNRSRLLPEFFAHLSQSAYGKAYFLSVAHKTTNLACINTTKLKGFPVLIPTKAEQGEIVQILESVACNLVNHARKKRLLEDLFRTLLHQLMTAQIRVNDLDLLNWRSHNE